LWIIRRNRQDGLRGKAQLPVGQFEPFVSPDLHLSFVAAHVAMQDALQAGGAAGRQLSLEQLAAQLEAERAARAAAQQLLHEVQAAHNTAVHVSGAVAAERDQLAGQLQELQV
jgi:hypothetical protein